MMLDWVRFLLYLEFLGLISIGDYDVFEADKLLNKDEEQLLKQHELALLVNVCVDDRNNVYHRIAFYRGLFETIGSNEDLQHCFDPGISPIANHDICCDMLGIDGSNSFDQIGKRRMCQALSRSKLLSGQALGTENITQFENICRDVLGMDGGLHAEQDVNLHDDMGWLDVGGVRG